MGEDVNRPTPIGAPTRAKERTAPRGRSTTHRLDVKLSPSAPLGPGSSNAILGRARVSGSHHDPLSAIIYQMWFFLTKRGAFVAVTSDENA